MSDATPDACYEYARDINIEDCYQYYMARQRYARVWFRARRVALLRVVTLRARIVIIEICVV